MAINKQRCYGGDAPGKSARINTPTVSPNSPDTYDGRNNPDAGSAHDPSDGADWNGPGKRIQTDA